MKSLFSKRKILRVTFLMTSVLTLNGWSYPSQAIEEERVYVTSEQIEVTDNGILVFFEGSESQVVARSLSFDEEGLYVEVECCYCPRGHQPRCKICRGCYKSSCPSHCRCSD